MTIFLFLLKHITRIKISNVLVNNISKHFIIQIRKTYFLKKKREGIPQLQPKEIAMYFFV